MVSQPATDPGLWAEYAACAEHSYRKHGVDCALDVEALRSVLARLRNIEEGRVAHPGAGYFSGRRMIE